jgi:4-amino-4-deoxy-L-arabinose transferase-like glycosyltransferase
MRFRSWVNIHPTIASLLIVPGFVLLGLTFSAVNPRYLAGFLLVPVICTIGITWTALISQPEEQAWLIRLCLAALGVRVLTSFSLEFIWPSFEGTSDGAAYGPHAAIIAESWHRIGFIRYADVVTTPVGAPGYVYFSAATFWLIGYNTLFMKLINGLLAALAAVYTYKLGRHFFDESVGRFSALITAFMPSLILWTSQNLKDSMVLFFSMWALWVAAQGLRWTAYRIPLLGLLIAVLATIRIETAIGLGVVIALTIGFQQSSGWSTRILFSALGIGVLGLTLATSGYGFLGEDFVSRNLTFDSINAKRQVTAYGGSAIEASGDINSLGSFIVYIPQAITNFLLRPWPWEATRSFTQIMTIPESLLLWYPLFAFSIVGLIHCWRTKAARTTLLWVYMLAATLAAAPQYGNLGTAYRHRIQLWPCYFILAAVGWRVWRQRKLSTKKPAAAIGVASPMEAGQP